MRDMLKAWFLYVSIFLLILSVLSFAPNITSRLLGDTPRLEVAAEALQEDVVAVWNQIKP